METTKSTKRDLEIRQALLMWSRNNPRFLPWKRDRDPYRIWVSEIILQQTRVDQGLPYYMRFISKYPSIQHLAASSENDLMKIWEGLGYYRRARNMLTAARKVVDNFNGIFPNEYEQILALNGIGPYTAAAISSFAFNKPYVVVDGNVVRLITRLQGIIDPVEENHTREIIQKHAEDLLDVEEPGTFNQAIMDFGSQQCKPANPDCNPCPLSRQCVALRKNLVGIIPVKKAKKPKRHRYFYYLVPVKGDFTYVKRRDEDDIWPQLHEFYLVETAGEVEWEAILKKSIYRLFRVQPNPENTNSCSLIK
ncbi:MAG: A/G-specific adenine glycosylase [Saprospiraceae bacterium]|nr:A/G-specific adenine glycosylase [Saprospiraceae bacterium]